jgi:hypothetical protein
VLRKALQDVTDRAAGLEQDLATFEMNMPEVERQRDEAYASVATLEQQLKDLRDKGFDLDTKEAVQRIHMAELAAAKTRAEAQAAVAAQQAAASQAQAVGVFVSCSCSTGATQVFLVHHLGCYHMIVEWLDFIDLKRFQINDTLIFKVSLTCIEKVHEMTFSL